MKNTIITAIVFISSIALAETYKVNPSTSSIQWTGFKKMGSSHTGKISIKEGSIEIKKDQIINAEFTVDMSTISNDDLANSPDYQKKLVGHLSSDDFFNVAKYPTASFKMTSAKMTSKNQYAVKGNLTMIGNTQPVEFSITTKIENKSISGSTKFKIDRTKWGLKYGSGNIFKELAADKIINDEFELEVKISN